MWILIIGLVVFFGVHSVRMVAPGFRAARIGTMGEMGWKGVYSLAALVGLALIVWGWMQYRPEAPEVFAPPEWGRHLTSLLVLLAFIFNFATYAPPGYIRRTVRHPFLLAIAMWALGHLLVNGDLASLIVFGAFFAYTIANAVAVTLRGDATPQAVSWRGDAIAVVAGVAGFALFAFVLHPLMFDIAPFG